MLRFNKKYFALTILLFLVEVLIAVFVDDKFIRPYVGDFLVVMLMYSFVMTFVNAPVKTVSLSVLLFAYTIEVLQYFKYVKFLGLHKSKLANVVMGNSFEWVDMLAYTLGIILVIIIEKIVSVNRIERQDAISVNSKNV